MKRRLMSILLILALALTLAVPGIAAEISEYGATVTGGDTILADGTYQLAANATGIVTVAAGKTVTLIGSGINAAANKELTVRCGAGVELTLQDVYIVNETNMNILDFAGTGNVLKAAGTNVLEAQGYWPSAAIHVGPTAALTFDDGGGDLYLYKRTQGSGVGSNAEEANGAITFAGGRWFIKGTKTGAVIGNDTCGDAAKEAQIGTITISGGELYVEANAQGAAIGGSRLSAGGDVIMTGGTAAIWVDYYGSAIGGGAVGKAGAEGKGSLTVTGGSLKVYVDANCVLEWGVKEAQACDNPITVTKKNAAGAAVVRYLLDTSAYTPNETGDAYVVTVDGAQVYSGGLHSYKYTANVENTMANWTRTDADSMLYLYLTEGSHSISVNGYAPETVTVTAPVYESGALEIPETSWADYADTSWYTLTDTVFEIATAEQLAGLAAIVNAGEDGDDFAGKTIRLTDDIDLSAHAWEPIGLFGFIGNESDFESYQYQGELETILKVVSGEREYSWISCSAFRGVFDGQGYSVSWILVGNRREHGHGLFGLVDNAEIKDLNVTSGYVEGCSGVSAIAGIALDSSISDCNSNVELLAQHYGSKGGGTGGNYAGGIVGLGDDCTVVRCENRGDVSGNRYSAGIVGCAGGLISDCVNYGSILTNQEYCGGIVGKVAGDSQTLNCQNHGELSGLTAGGIVGFGSSGTHYIKRCLNDAFISCGRQGGGILDSCGSPGVVFVDSCANHGDVTASRGDGNGVGGIAATVKPGDALLNCYNTGNVSGTGSTVTKYYGGVTGDLFGASVINCYNAGNVSSIRDTDYVGGFAGYVSVGENTVVRNNYYLTGTAASAVGDGTTAGTEKSSGQLAMLAETLGSAYVTDTASLNGGYPILAWEQTGVPEQSIYSLSFSVTPTEAVIVVQNQADGITIPANSDGSYSIVSAYIYDYSASADGYETVSGTVNGADGNQTVTLTMTEVSTYKLYFSLTPADAAVSLTNDSDGTAVSANSDGSYEMVLGCTYSYTVSAEGYQSSSGTVIGADGDQTITLTLSTVKLGDVNGDGKINAADSILVAKYRAKLITFTDEQRTAADVNKDGKVNAADSILIAKYRAKLITSF